MSIQSALTYPDVDVKEAKPAIDTASDPPPRLPLINQLGPGAYGTHRAQHPFR